MEFSNNLKNLWPASIVYAGQTLGTEPGTTDIKNQRMVFEPFIQPNLQVNDVILAKPNGSFECNTKVIPVKRLPASISCAAQTLNTEPSPSVVNYQSARIRPFIEYIMKVKKEPMEEDTTAPYPIKLEKLSSNIPKNMSDKPNDTFECDTEIASVIYSPAIMTKSVQTLDTEPAPSVIEDQKYTKVKEDYSFQYATKVTSVKYSPGTTTQGIQTSDVESDSDEDTKDTVILPKRAKTITPSSHGYRESRSEMSGRENNSFEWPTYSSDVKVENVRVEPKTEVEELLLPNDANAQDPFNLGELLPKQDNSFDSANRIRCVQFSPTPEMCAIQTLDTEPGSSDRSEANIQKHGAYYIAEKLSPVPFEVMSDTEQNSFEWPTNFTSVNQSPDLLTSAAQSSDSETGLLSIKGQRVTVGTYIDPSSEVTENTRDQNHPTSEEKLVAHKVLEKLSSIPLDQMSDQQKDSFEWASKVTTVPTDERNNSFEESAIPAPKKANIRTSTVSAQQIPIPIVVAIVDKARPNGIISLNKWRLLEAKLASLLLHILREHPGPSPSCEDAGWFEGYIKIIVCADLRSLGLLKIAIPQVGEVWRGARIEIWMMDQLQNRPRAIVRLPVEPSNKKDIMELIRIGNPILNTSDWKISRLDDPKATSRLAVIVINDESLYQLAEAGNKIFYGFGMISLKIYLKGLGRVTSEPCIPLYRQQV